MGLDEFAQQQTQDDGGEKGDEHVGDKAARWRIMRQAAQHGEDFLRVDEDDGKDGPGLDGDLKDFGFLVLKTE